LGGFVVFMPQILPLFDVDFCGLLCTFVENPSQNPSHVTESMPDVMCCRHMRSDANN